MYKMRSVATWFVWLPKAEESVTAASQQKALGAPEYNALCVYNVQQVVWHEREHTPFA